MTKRQKRKSRKERREPNYLACLMAFGPKPDTFREQGEWKRQIIQWWLDSIKSTPPPKERAGHRFYTRYMAWYHAEGKSYVEAKGTE